MSKYRFYSEKLSRTLLNSTGRTEVFPLRHAPKKRMSTVFCGALKQRVPEPKFSPFPSSMPFFLHIPCGKAPNRVHKCPFPTHLVQLSICLQVKWKLLRMLGGIVKAVNFLELFFVQECVLSLSHFPPLSMVQRVFYVDELFVNSLTCGQNVTQYFAAVVLEHLKFFSLELPENFSSFQES